MERMLKVGLILGLLALPHDADALNVGDALPKFFLRGHDGTTYSPSNFKNGVLVLYFFGFN